VAEAVVHQLEVVEIDEEDAYALGRADRALEAQLEMLEKGGPVGQPGQGVVQRRVLEFLPRLDLHVLAITDVCDDPTDQQSAILVLSLGAHPIQDPAHLAIRIDEPILDLDRLAPPQGLGRGVVQLPILRVDRSVIGLFRGHALGNRSEQRVQADEGQTLVAPVGPELHLVEHDRHRSCDPLQELCTVLIKPGTQCLFCHEPGYRQHQRPT